MNVKNLLAGLLLCTALPYVQLTARPNTPVETFIRQVKQNTPFVPISNIWQPDDQLNQTAMLEKVEKAQPLTIDYAAVARLVKEGHSAISLTIPAIGGGTYTIELARYSFLSNDFEVHTLGENNKDEIFHYTPGVYYQGVVKGIPGSMATFSFFNNEVYGLFAIPGEGNYNLVPNVMLGKYYDYNTHYVLYNEKDLKLMQYAPHCETDNLPYIEEPAAKTTTTVNNKVYNSCTEVRVFEVGDYALYQTKSSSTTNVTNYLTALFNNQNLLYRNEGVPTVLKYIQVNTASDNYQHITTSSSSIFLDTFGKVTQNTLHGCDLAILASTRLNGGYGALGGVAWLRALCASYSASSFFGPYAFCNMDNSGVTNFPTFSWDVEVMTHEMGHIVGSPHTHACCWNPPARNTAIDGCYTLEGSCAMPVPQYPAAGGTIMSYCHLVSGVGINLSNGFGPQPGDTIRRYINSKFSSTCGAVFHDTLPLTKANRILTANRECTDAGTTYYWYDNNTADHSDDTLVLMLVKNGNTIGTLDSTGFSVSTGTLVNYGGGRGDTATFPSGITGLLGRNITMRRYWSITPTAAPTSAVEVIFPFTDADTSDVNGSVPGTTAPLASYLMYKANAPVDPNPANNFSGATAANFTIYTYGTSASTTNWSLTTIGTARLAHMKMTNLSGGGSGMYTYPRPTGINDPNGGNKLFVYPNPTADQWFVTIPADMMQGAAFQLYTADGRLVRSQLLQSDMVNTVNAAGLAPGIYYYRAISGNDVLTGSMVKE